VPRDRAARGGGRELHDATCAQCGAAARVPFKPVPGRPVYCRDCYASRAASAGGR
jgi:CxxC-x17-CxxC domain-containing protein